jgi:tellurite resistance protein TerC
VIRLFRRFVPMVSAYHGDRFFIREKLELRATPLLLVVAVLGVTDVIFATDSIPAIFGVTQDPFIIYSSNIFAVLGLRALFFVVSTMMTRFHLLKFGLALILAFIGVKMLIVDLYVFPFAGALGIDHPLKIPIGAALGVVAALLALSVVGSLIFPAPEEPRPS